MDDASPQLPPASPVGPPPPIRTGRRQSLLVLVALVAVVLAVVIAREATPTRSLIRSLHSSDEATRLQAATDLNNLTVVDLPSATRAVAVAMVSDPSPAVRTEAARTMGTLGGEAIMHHDDLNRDQALGALLATLDDKDAGVAEVAITMISVLANAASIQSGNPNDLAPLGAPQAVVAKLMPILLGSNEGLRKAAATSLESFPVQLDAFLPDLFARAAAEPSGANPRSSGVMTALLREVRPLRGSIPFLMKSLGSPEPKARALAIATLGQAGPDAIDAVPELIRILGDPAGADGRDDPGRAAATALGTIAADTPRALEATTALHEAQTAAVKGRERAIAGALRALDASKP